MSVAANILIPLFIKKTHNTLDFIHGKENIDIIFNGLNQNMLEDLVNLYTRTFFERYYSVYTFLDKFNMFDNKPYEPTFITSIFICAIQHYL
tara:strand:+ start:1509 stop:1784 length:276 start_codon:yes stop_codon:yes gene_type:complete